MTERRLASLAIGVLGLFWIGEGLQIVGFSVSAFLPSGSQATVETTFAPLVASAISLAFPGFLFLLARERIAAWLCPTNGTQEGRIAEGQAVAFAVLGAYFVVRGLARVGSNLLSNVPSGFSWGSALECVFGAVLFVGANRLAILWSKLRGMQAETH